MNNKILIVQSHVVSLYGTVLTTIIVKITLHCEMLRHHFISHCSQIK